MPKRSLRPKSTRRVTMVNNRFGIPIRQEEIGYRRPSARKSFREQEILFIQQNIKMRQCISFVRDGPISRFCQCGDLENNHTDQAKANARDETESWIPDRDTAPAKTDAFGQIKFNHGGDRVAKYVRADTNTSEEHILRLLSGAWGLEMPSLVIAVTGGKLGDTKIRLADAFRHGLMKAASSTGAWIVTAGTNLGITKVVGEAVHDYYLTSLNRVVTIGVAPWGCIQNRDVLVQRDGQSVVAYRVRGKPNPNLAFLDPNHSHFILADNGSRGQLDAQLSFKNTVLKAISSAKIDSGIDSFNDINVPVCLLVVNGDQGTLKEVHEAVCMGIPTVIIKGSGKIADVLAYAHQSLQAQQASNKGQITVDSGSLSPEAMTEIVRMLRTIIPGSDVSTFVRWVEDCMQCENVISVLEFHTKTSAVDVDLAILKAFMKVRTGQATNQLKLALAWNRIDIAESFINSDVDLRQGSCLRRLDDAMQMAILQGNAKFVCLLMDNGIVLKEFLTGFQLQDLYNNIPTTCLLHRLLAKEREGEKEFTLVDVGKVIKRLVSVFHKHEYLTDPMYQSMDNVLELDDYEMHTTTTTLSSREYNDESNFCLQKQGQHLFTWAILMNKQELSKVFWKESKESLAMALFAQSILMALMKYTNDQDELTELQLSADKYGELAYGVLGACYSSDPSRTFAIMTRCIPQWGSTNCLLLAYHADERRFLAHMACQSLLDQIWKGSIEGGNFCKILCCALCPLFVCCIRFVPKKKTFISKTLAATGKLRSQDSTTRSCHSQGGFAPGRFYQRLKDFYRAPVVKFGLHVVFYTWFLLMYSYLLVVKMDKDFHFLEAVLIAWVATISIEEIRQVFMSYGSSMKNKVLQYLFSSWNILDLITVLLFAIGMVLRHGIEHRAEESRIVLSLNLISFFIRLLHIFSVNSTLGPILVMISSMVKDLMWFGIIILVFILSYGIASESVLCPNTQLEWSMLYSIPRRAYWQMYGNLFLEEIEGEANRTCPNLEDGQTDCSRGFCTSVKSKYYVLVLLGIYVLLTNVLLLNLVIAMFSNTFKKIQEKSNLHWCYQRFGLVYEYSNIPVLPPPFIIISHIKFLILKCCRTCRKVATVPSPFWTKLPTNEDRTLVKWEHVITDNYVRFMERSQAGSMERRQEATTERLQDILSKMDDMQIAINRLCKMNNNRPDRSSEDQRVPPQPSPPTQHAAAPRHRTNTIVYNSK